MTYTKSQRVRSQLKHPVVDADGHWLEMHPVFFDYLAEVGGPGAVDRYREAIKGVPGYGKTNDASASPDMRMAKRIRRQGWWTLNTRARDRAAFIAPKLAYDSLDEWGIDVGLVYPTLGFVLPKLIEDWDQRQAAVRAYNLMVADLFRPYADRLIPAAVISLDTPSEALEQLEHARALGHKLLVMNGTAQRPIEGDADIPAARRRYYLDGFGLDSPFDYDPVWKKLIEMKTALTVHTGSMGWPDRSSPTSFVHNHMGHFAQSHHLSARSLFMGGVTQRFPALKIAFLEGGVGWACNLYSEIIGHWKKRNRKYMDQNFNPMLLDKKELRRLLERNTNERFASKLDDIMRSNLETAEPDVTQEQLFERERNSDEFDHVHIDSVADIRRLFAQNFYFGCEADDPMTTMAFHERAGVRLKAMMGSDIGHFDVPDATEVLEEAWEMVEHGLLTEQQFREFTLTNAVELHASMNPDFFRGTPVEAAAREEMKLAAQRDFVKSPGAQSAHAAPSAASPVD